MGKCNICKNTSKLYTEILSMQICSDCLDDIAQVNIGDESYDHYKEIIKDAYINWMS